MDDQIDKKFNSLRYAHAFSITDSDQFRLEKVLSFIGNNKKVLDIGCGDGFVMEKIKKQRNAVSGIEISIPSIRSARKRGFVVYDISLNDIHWSKKIKQKFDVVWVGEVIEHIFDTDSFLENVRRVLKKDGKMVLSTPNLASFGRRILHLFGINPLLETTARKQDAGHIRYFTFRNLTQLLKEHRFDVEQITSSVVNFDNSGKHFSKTLADIFPHLGNTIIVKARKMT